MYYTIDRFEGLFAICEERETGKMVNIHITRIQDGAKEGDIIKNIDGNYIIDEEETKKIKEEVQQKFSNLWE